MTRTPRARVEPQPQDLPGMENRKLAAVERLVHVYADLRLQREAVQRQEHAVKSQLITLLKKHNRTTYQRNGMLLELVAGAESIRVRVARADEDDEAPTVNGDDVITAEELEDTPDDEDDEPEAAVRS